MAWYSAGTVTVTNGSGNIIGAGTAFVDAGLKAGMAFIGPDLLVRQITAVASNTQLTVTPPWASATGNGQGYMILPTSSMTADLIAAVQALIQTFASVRDGVGQGMFGDGSAAVPGIRFLLDQDTGIARGGVDAIALICGGRIVGGFTVGSATIGTNLFSDGVMELGYNGQGDRASFIDFHSDDTFSDFGFRILKNAGANGGAQLLARGTGGLQLVTIDASNVSIGAGNLLRWQFGQDGAFLPFTDASYNIGGAGNRVGLVYSAGGVNTTSDERLKQWRGALTDAELSAAKEIAGTIGIYQWLSSIAAKGADKARLHCGVKAQQVWGIMAAHRLVDPIAAGEASSRYAFLSYDKWDAMAATPAAAEVRDADDKLVTAAMPAQPGRDAGDRFGVIASDLALFLIAAQEQRLAAIEAKLAA